MANATKITSLRRERNNLNGQFQFVSRLLDEYVQYGQHNKATLITCRKQIDDTCKQFNIVNDKLLEIDDSAPVDLIDVYFDLVERLLALTDINPSSTDAFKTAVNLKPPECSSNTSSNFRGDNKPSETKRLSREAIVNPQSAATLAKEDKLISLRRRRDDYSDRFTYLSKRLDEYEQSGHQKSSVLIYYTEQLTEDTNQFEAIQLELEELDDDAQTSSFEIRDQYNNLLIRIDCLLNSARSATPIPKGSSNTSNHF